MTEIRAPGLCGDWLNGWLAAVGVTVLVDGCRLRWTDERRPAAVFTALGDAPLAAQLADTLPGEDALRSLAITNEGRAFPRNVTVAIFEAAAQRSRPLPTDHSLSASVTDLVTERDDNLPHSPFDPSAPRGETLWTRLLACRRELPTDSAALAAAIALTFEGRGRRCAINGLGFDARRLEAGDPPAGGKYVNPAVECLAFNGLSLFPLRGDGRRWAAARGWRRGAPAPGQRHADMVLCWPIWSEPLDRWGVDALLGRFFAGLTKERGDVSLGIHRRFATVSYKRTGDMDQTAGYATRRT